jgi:hypothetical protein
MEQITHQLPRQRGYESTSSLRNDSLKHTRKHERKEGGIEPRNKSVKHRRTVRPGGVDCPQRPRGLSSQEPRTVWPGAADNPARSRGQSDQEPRIVHKSQQNHQRRTGKNGLSARTGRTVRIGSEPSATEARTVRKPAATKT